MRVLNGPYRELDSFRLRVSGHLGKTVTSSISPAISLEVSALGGLGTIGGQDKSAGVMSGSVGKTIPRFGTI